MAKKNLDKKVFSIKCGCLPKEDRNIYKRLLIKVEKAKKE